MASYKIDEIEGIGPAMAAKLAEADIQKTDDLLSQCSSPSGRQGISERTGISAAKLLKWSNLADLMRISGIGRQYSELLEAAGVDTVKELRTRRADNLTLKMKEINEEKRLARTSPAETVVSGWIEAAKQTEPMITH